MSRLDEFAEWLVDHRRAVIVAVLLATVALGSGAPAVQLETSLEAFRGGTDAAAADDYVEQNFRPGDENTSAAVVLVSRDYQILTREAYIDHIRYQQALRENETVSATFPEGKPPISLANVVATVAIARERGTDLENVSVESMPPLDEQIAELEASDRTEIQVYTLEAFLVLSDVGSDGPDGGPYAYLPTSFVADEANGRIAETTAIVVRQRENITSDRLTRSQVAMRQIATPPPGTNESEDGPWLDSGRARVFGQGIINDELDRSTTDSLLLVGPIGVLFVLGVLLVAYRDWLDVVLGLVGLVVVQVWTFGFMGWAGIDFNQLFVAAPVFLLGLAIDYAIHVTMRQREERGSASALDPRVVFLGESGDPGVTRSMVAALGGVGAALLLVTVTTATGFASNVVSPVLPIREFGVVSAVGIVAALVTFGGLVPSLKVEVDEYLEARGHDRRRAPFGTDQASLKRLLGQGVSVAQDTPWTAVGLAVLAASLGAYGATQVDTTFQTQELLVQEVPEWTRDLPAPFAPGNYTTLETLSFLESQGIVYDGTVAQVLVRGDVTGDDALERMWRAQNRANSSSVTVDLAAGGNATTSPVTAMRAVASANESFNDTFTAADTDGNRVPDRNLEAVYDAFYETRPEAASAVVHREDGEYRALLLTAFTNGTASNAAVTRTMRLAAEPVQGGGLRAQPTGEPVMLAVVASNLLQTVVSSLALTLGVVLALLAIVYRRTRGSATLGVVTLLPVLFAVAWILGTMWLLGVPFNVMTALITSFTIGLGVDYSIHVSERYVQELERQSSVAAALRTSVFGTGGALLGSAATTAGGFGVLVFAILNPLQQFGLITAMTIVYSFVGSVLVLPSLLVLWTRWTGYGTEAAESDGFELAAETTDD